jgi:pimeloyl-ACP methyl ester carboxylesterase
MGARGTSRRRFLGLAASVAALGAPLPVRVRAASAARDPKHFVLIHGAWHGAWCWYKVLPALEAAGHQATALDLPSGGVDLTPAAGVTREQQTARVVALLDELREPVVLVGHSAGGMVISTVAEARPDKIERLVYLSAFLLPNGASPVAEAARDEGSTLSAHLQFSPDGTIVVDPSARRDVFYGDCDDRDVALAQSLLRPIGLRTTTDLLVLGAGFERVRRFYVSCLRDQAISPAFQQRMYTALPCERVLTIPSDHSPFLSHPGALLRALMTIARA